MGVNTNNLLEDLEFILRCFEQSEICEDSFDFGPAYSLAVSDNKLAKTKLRRIIRKVKLNIEYGEIGNNEKLIQKD